MHVWRYPCSVERVVDGDTLDGVLDLGFRISYRARVRLLGFDAPEIFRPRDALERHLGELVAAELRRLVVDRSCELESNRLDSFGRVLGRVYVSGEDISPKLVAFLAGLSS